MGGVMASPRSLARIRAGDGWGGEREERGDTGEDGYAGAAVSAAPPTHTSGISAAAIVVAVIAALLALACAAWGLASMQAFEPRWTLSLRHAVAEAGFRASATWAEFSDWARLGH
jgi:hypothetical protein